MNIVAPISRVEEIPVLAQAGADELYCGVVPQDWIEKFNSSGVNRRLFGNLQGYADLERAAAEAATAGCRLSLVLNAQHYGEAQIDSLIALARRFEALGGHALIVGDVALIAALGEADLGLRVHVSSVATCRNTEAARFYGDLGVARVILPRDVTVAEVTRIAKALPHLEVEAFVLNDGCVFEEGVCHTIHLPGKLGGPICLDNYRYRYEGADGGALTEPMQQWLDANDEDYRNWLWYRFGCGFSVTPGGLPYGPCGLCALPAFHAAGLASVKIAGREAPTERKLKSVEMVRRALDRIESGASAEQFMDWARGLRGEPQRCDSGYMCYYPEVLDREPR